MEALEDRATLALGNAGTGIFHGRLEHEALVAPIPELRIEDNRAHAHVEATITVDAHAALGRPGAESRELTVSPAGSYMSSRSVTVRPSWSTALP